MRIILVCSGDDVLFLIFGKYTDKQSAQPATTAAQRLKMQRQFLKRRSSPRAP